MDYNQLKSVGYIHMGVAYGPIYSHGGLVDGSFAWGPCLLV